MIYEHWPLWAQIFLAPVVFWLLVLLVAWLQLVWMRVVDRAMRSPVMNREPFFASRTSKGSSAKLSHTRLRIATERHAHGYICGSCGSPTRSIVVVRLYDGVARCCTDCAGIYAPEVAA